MSEDRLRVYLKDGTEVEIFGMKSSFVSVLLFAFLRARGRPDSFLLCKIVATGAIRTVRIDEF